MASPVPMPTVLTPIAPPSLSSGPDELCPVCRRVMVPAAELQDGLESSALTADRSEFEYFAYRGGGAMGTFMLFDMLVDMVVNAVFGAAQRRRLRRVARDYPASLVCGGCGHIVKRRF